MRSLLLILIFLIFSVTTTYAQNATSSSSVKRDSTKQMELNKRRDLIKNNIERLNLDEKKSNLNREKVKEAKILSVRKQTALKLFNVTHKRYSAAILRLEILIQRINNRLAIIKSENPNISTTGIDKQVETASNLLTDAGKNLDAVNANLETVLNSENPKESFTVLKEELKSIKTQLKEVHTILIKTIKDIKGLRVGNTQLRLPTPNNKEGDL